MTVQIFTPGQRMWISSPDYIHNNVIKFTVEVSNHLQYLHMTKKVDTAKPTKEMIKLPVHFQIRVSE